MKRNFLCETCEAYEKSLYLELTEAVHGGLLRTGEDRFVTRRGARGDDGLEMSLHCKIQKTPTSSGSTAKSGDDDGGVENETHAKRWF